MSRRQNPGHQKSTSSDNGVDLIEGRPSPVDWWLNRPERARNYSPLLKQVLKDAVLAAGKGRDKTARALFKRAAELHKSEVDAMRPVRRPPGRPKGSKKKNDQDADAVQWMEMHSADMGEVRRYRLARLAIEAGVVRPFAERARNSITRRLVRKFDRARRIDK